MKSFWTIAALVVGLGSLGVYGYAAANGIVWGSPKETFVPEEVRSKPGGFRSSPRIWLVGHGGYRGGK